MEKYILEYKEIIKEDDYSCLINIDHTTYRYFPHHFCEIDRIKKTITCPGWLIIENQIEDCAIEKVKK